MIGIEAVNQQIEMFAEIRQHDPDLFKAPAIRNYPISRRAQEVGSGRASTFWNFFRYSICLADSAASI